MSWFLHLHLLYTRLHILRKFIRCRIRARKYTTSILYIHKYVNVQMDSKSLIHHDDKPKLLRALLLRHRHVNENAHGFPFGARRKFSSYTSLQVICIECFGIGFSFTSSNPSNISNCSFLSFGFMTFLSSIFVFFLFCLFGFTKCMCVFFCCCCCQWSFYFRPSSASMVIYLFWTVFLSCSHTHTHHGCASGKWSRISPYNISRVKGAFSD